MRITVIGTGYVGLVTGACFADLGMEVTCLDKNADRVAGLLRGEVPFYEPGLEAMVQRNARSGRLQFTTDAETAVRFGAYLFIAVPTPEAEDGSADLRFVKAVATSIGTLINEPKHVVVKSTVPVGTGDMVEQTIREGLAARGVEIAFDVVSNPEFLKEGAAIEDFTRPDRIIVGVESAEARDAMRALYEPLLRHHDRLMFMDRRSSELTKYAANAMLATRISFMNDLARVAGATGADIEAIRRGVGSDSRIGQSFLYAGCGYGGSCFPKDVSALRHVALKETGQDMRLLAAVEDINSDQKRVLVEMVKSVFGTDLSGMHFALWGLAFKPGTDDMREAPSLTMISALLEAGATVAGFDPIAGATARVAVGTLDGMRFAGSAMGALDGADALLIATEWKEFRSPDFADMAVRMKGRHIFDGRNLFSAAQLKGSGFTYEGIGRSIPSG